MSRALNSKDIEVIVGLVGGIFAILESVDPLLAREDGLGEHLHRFVDALPEPVDGPSTDEDPVSSGAGL